MIKPRSFLRFCSSESLRRPVDQLRGYTCLTFYVETNIRTISKRNIYEHHEVYISESSLENNGKHTRKKDKKTKLKTRSNVLTSVLVFDFYFSFFFKSYHCFIGLSPYLSHTLTLRRLSWSSLPLRTGITTISCTQKFVDVYLVCKMVNKTFHYSKGYITKRKLPYLYLKLVLRKSLSI